MEIQVISDVIVIDYTIQMTKADGEDIFSCYIPKYQLIYGARDKESALKKGEVMVRSWIDMCHRHAKGEFKKDK